MHLDFKTIGMIWDEDEIAIITEQRIRGEAQCKAAFTPGQHVARQHVAVNMLLVAVNKTVASLLPVCCWIQRDTSRP